MGSWDRDLYGGVSNPILYKISATVTEGTIYMRTATASDGGELAIATTTAALNCLGCATEAATYSTTQGDAEGVVRLIPQPFAVWKFRISGTSVQNAALATASPAQILVNDTVSTTGLVVTDTAVGTIDMSGGLIKGRTGANAGTIRKQTSHNNNTDTNVVVPFPNDIAANDTFIRVPYSRSAIAMQTVATTIDQADGAIAYGTGIPVEVTDVLIKERGDSPIVAGADEAFVYVVFRTHMFNSLA